MNQLNAETICTSKQSLADAVCKKDNPFKQLCQQLVREDKDVPRLEAIFKSMFNQDGRVEKEICEFEQQRVNLDTCPTSFKPVGTQDKCHECVQFYQAMKSNDLKTIVTQMNSYSFKKRLSFCLGTFTYWISCHV